MRLSVFAGAYGSDEDDEEREEQNEAEAARSAPGAASGRDSGCGGSGKKSVGGLKATLQEIDGKGEDKTDRRSSGRRKKWLRRSAINSSGIVTVLLSGRVGHACKWISSDRLHCYSPTVEAVGMSAPALQVMCDHPRP